MKFTLLPLTARRPARVVLDLSDLTFISSLGLGALVEFRRGLVRNGGQVWLAAPSPQIHELLEMSGLLAIFPVASSVSAAFAAETPR